MLCNVSQDARALIADCPAARRGRIDLAGQPIEARPFDGQRPIEADIGSLHRSDPDQSKNSNTRRPQLVLEVSIASKPGATAIPNNRRAAGERQAGFLSTVTEQSAHEILGLAPGASETQIKAHFAEIAMQFYVDMSASGGSDASKLAQAKAARDFLLGHRAPTIQHGPDAKEADEGEAAGADEATALGFDVEAHVRKFMVRHDLTIRFNGTVRVGPAPPPLNGRANIDELLAHIPDQGHDYLLNMVLLEAARDGLSLKVTDCARAIWKIAQDDQRNRHIEIMRPYLHASPDAAECERAQTEWERLVDTCFDIAPVLGIAVLKQFIWQVKRKAVFQTIEYHLMPVIMSRMQGTGKSTMVRWFLRPLQELASEPVTLAEYADARSGDVYRFPVVPIDDIDALDPRAVPLLKCLMTEQAVRRRTAMSAKTRYTPLQSTLIGTANEPIGTLIPDRTGHRRFATLPFRNGDETKGGQRVVWDVICATDYALLWRSVDVAGPAPIKDHLKMLHALQDAERPRDTLREWVYAQDFRSSQFDDIRTTTGLSAQGLRLRYCEATGEQISPNQFEQRMAALVHEADMPLRPKVRVSKGNFYGLKKGTSKQFAPGTLHA